MYLTDHLGIFFLTIILTIFKNSRITVSKMFCKKKYSGGSWEAQLVKRLLSAQAMILGS